MNELPDRLELVESSQSEDLLPNFGFEMWMVPAAIAVLLALLALVLILRKLRKKKGAPDSQSLREAALAEALTALDTVDSATARQAAVQCSLILRRYLAQAAEDPALFETHEEFVSRQDSLNALTEEARAASAQGFTRLAALKYSPREATEEETPQAVVDETRTLLHTLHHGFRA